MSTVHIPILVAPIISALIEPLDVTNGESAWLVDCTFGGGGHTGALLSALENNPKYKNVKILAFDQDPDAISRGRERFSKEISAGRLEIQKSRFGHAVDFFTGKSIVGLMADLGFSSDQIEDSERGLSFMSDGPLDMRLDPTQGRSCRDYLLTVTERELEKTLSELGEERFSRRIAGAIVESRRQKALPRTSRELAELITKAVPPPARHGRIHAATRSFQALRILVNEEMNELDSLLERVILELRPGGRVAILSFHSLEDRKVKQAFQKEGFEKLTKKPIQADDQEIQTNPRSRSAKLRIATRV
jgi:16S rRNA (cytosine1402-N4)-methyltransferase